jgi:hypothetical protein
MLSERQAQDERIENAMAAALLAIEDRAAAQAQVEQEERTLAAALQRLSLESVTVRDIMTLAGLGEKYVTRLLRMRLDADANADSWACRGYGFRASSIVSDQNASLGGSAPAGKRRM